MSAHLTDVIQSKALENPVKTKVKINEAEIYKQLVGIHIKEEECAIR